MFLLHKPNTAASLILGAPRQQNGIAHLSYNFSGSQFLNESNTKLVVCITTQSLVLHTNTESSHLSQLLHHYRPIRSADIHACSNSNILTATPRGFCSFSQSVSASETTFLRLSGYSLFLQKQTQDASLPQTLQLSVMVRWSKDRTQAGSGVNKMETTAGVWQQSGFTCSAADNFQHTQNPHAHA